MSKKWYSVKEFWERFEKWEDEWKKKRQDEIIEEAGKLREAEQDYERSLKTFNPLEPKPKEPKEILGTNAPEPGHKRLSLQNSENHPLILPVEVIRIERLSRDKARIYIKGGDEDDREYFEPMAFQIKKLIEYMIDERVLFFLQPKDKGSLLIQNAWEGSEAPIFEVEFYGGGSISIKMLKPQIDWSSGYVFDCREILENILKRFQKEIKD